jgi:hypothetical protein
MTLHSFEEDGTMGWVCPHCNISNTAHVSHEEVEVFHRAGSPLHHRTVGLPTCTCGSRTYLRVDFKDEELKIEGRAAVAERHKAFIARMEAIGKPVMAQSESQ